MGLAMVLTSCWIILSRNHTLERAHKLILAHEEQYRGLWLAVTSLPGADEALEKLKAECDNWGMEVQDCAQVCFNTSQMLASFVS